MWPTAYSTTETAYIKGSDEVFRHLHTPAPAYPKAGRMSEAMADQRVSVRPSKSIRGYSTTKAMADLRHRIKIWTEYKEE